MKIKRFFSQDMRTVIRSVREELGPDAVILSNNRVNGGVEIIAAIDYDESILSGKSDKKNTANETSVNVVTERSKPPNATPANSKPSPAKTTISDDDGLKADLVELSSSAPLLVNQGIERGQESQSPPKKTSSTHFNIDEISKELAILGGAEGENSNTSLSQQRNTETIDYYRSKSYQGNSEQQFYMLDDAGHEPSGGGPMAKNGERHSTNNSNVWSQEPTLVAMQNEIVSLRGLLEQQLTGLAWGETERQNPIRAKLLRQLLELDLNPDVARKIADCQEVYTDYQSAWQTALTYMTDSLPVIDEDLIISGGVIALVGPTGVGKTTSIVKLASRYALRYGRKNIGLITIDNYRVGAHEQLKTYSKIFDISLRVASNKDSLRDAIKSMSDKHLILIDTAGLSHRDVRMNSQLAMLENCSPNLKTLLVFPATHYRTVLEETVVMFKKAKLAGCIITKLDETTILGGAISVLLNFNLPVAYYCDGQKVPDNLHIATAHSLINRSVLIARKTNQPLGKEAIQQAFTGLNLNAQI
ncbi:MAG: flagellar biosynthesis protein FlhF, partial [Thiohalomonadales bacterium]